MEKNISSVPISLNILCKNGYTHHLELIWIRCERRAYACDYCCHLQTPYSWDL